MPYLINNFTCVCLCRADSTTYCWLDRRKRPLWTTTTRTKSQLSKHSGIWSQCDVLPFYSVQPVPLNCYHSSLFYGFFWTIGYYYIINMLFSCRFLGYGEAQKVPKLHFPSFTIFPPTATHLQDIYFLYTTLRTSK